MYSNSFFRQIIKLLAVFFLGGYLSAQIVDIRDTLKLERGLTRYFLKHGLILTDSFLFSDSALIHLDSIQTILGFVDITNMGPARKLEVTYKYLSSAVPLIAGPIPAHIPALDSLAEKEKKIPPLQILELPVNEDVLFTSGSFFRSMNITGSGGTELGGGLRFQLNGRMGKDIQVSGVITDESFPIQPQGNTKSLEEIDKVYLEVIQPRARTIAGDVLFERSGKKFSSIRRNMIGLENRIELENWQSSVNVGSLKGTYKRLEFKGQEGRQGPYYLTGKNESRDVIIAAGSEKVWVREKALTRGANHDYIIDYSTAELFFTSKILIDFDTDILIEYQYSDFQFDRNLIAASVKRNYASLSSLEISWIREKDQTGRDFKSSGTADLLKNSGDDPALIQTSQVDQSGDYYLSNGIFIYDPNKTAPSEDRYMVSFYLADKGLYERQISEAGIIYYKYSEQAPGTWFLDLYNPEKIVNAPTSHDMVNLSFNQNINQDLELQADLSFSVLDNNILSNRGDANNTGLAHDLIFTGSNLNFGSNGTWSYKLESWSKQSTFKEMQNDRELLFNRKWNIYGQPSGNEVMLDLFTSLNWDQYMGLDLNLQRYRLGKLTFNRIYNEYFYRGEYLHNLEAYVNLVKSDKLFRQLYLQTEFLKGRFHPFLKVNYEMDEDSVSFTHLAGGYKYRHEYTSSTFSLGRRIDSAVRDKSAARMSVVSTAYFAELDWARKSRSGWNQSLTVRKRILGFSNSQPDKSIVLGRILFGYHQNNNPIIWDMGADLDETYSEERAVVYDSVGTGLGNFRYDPVFNIYIRDEKGAFISRTIFTGKRIPSVKFNSTQSLRVDFSRTGIKKLSGVNYRIDFKNDYQGGVLSVGKILNAGLDEEGILSGRYTLRQELDYFPQLLGRRLRFWHQISRYLDGFDPRGPQLTQKSEFGSLIQGDYWKNIQPFGNGHLRDISISSSGFYENNRKFKGYSAELGLKGQIQGQWQWSFSLEKMNDFGNTLKNDRFDANSRGLKSRVLRLGKKSRLEVQLEWNESGNEGNSLPPEALRGLALGETIKLTLSGSAFLGRNLSLNFNILYLNDSRYDHFITMRGEIRAYF